MTIIGSASIQIRADDKFFEPDVRRAVAKIKNLSIKLRVDADTSAASKKIRDLRYRLTQKDAEIKIRANDAKFEDDVRKAVNRIRNVSIDLKSDVDISKASKKIRDLRSRITKNVAVIKIDADTSRAEEKMRKFLEKFTENKKFEFTAVANTGEANSALEELKRKYTSNRVPFTADANTRAANAALAFTARARRARIFAFVDDRSVAALKGVFNALTGTLPMEKIRGVLTGILANFESIVTKGTAAVAVISALGASVLTLGANIFSIAGDITQVIGISAMLPAAFIAFGATIAANTMAWKGFGEALSSDPKKAAEAIAKLPPAAQSAVISMRGVGKAIKDATQVSFWSNMNGVIEYAVERLLPELVAGFGAVGSALGQLENVGITALADAFGGGVLEGILSNVAQMLSNLSGGVGQFVAAFATLARVGSTYLPAIGTYLTDAATRFNDFIQKADEAGKINQWIETAARRFGELKDIVLSTTSIMGALTDIARISGAPGLTEMAAGFERVANTVNSEPFTSRLLSMLEGARRGTDALGAGLSTLTELFWRSADSISAFVEIGGEIAGLAFENITALFEGTGLGNGLYAALMGLKEAMSILEPGFANLGRAVGDLGMIAGALLVSMAPGLNMLAATISGVVGGLRDGFIAAMEPLNAFIQSILNLAQGPVIGLANVIGNILELFGDLPNVVQVATAVFVAFIMLKPRFDAFWVGLQAKAITTWTAIGTTATSNSARVVAALQAQATAANGASAQQVAAANRAAAALSALTARQQAAGSAATAAAGTQAAASAAAAAAATAGAAAAGRAADNAGTRVGLMSLSTQQHAQRIQGAWSAVPVAFRGIGPAAEGQVGGMRNFGAAAAAAGSAIGTTATSGLMGAGKGLMTMLGGPWGVALMAAGAAIALFAQKQQEAKAQVEAFSQTLDKQTGAFTNATKGKLAEGILDLDESALQKFGNWLDGASESATEILDKIGVSVDDVTEKLMAAEGAQEYMDAWKEISTTLTQGRDVSEELANKIGSTADALNNMDSNEVAKVGNDIRDAGEAALKAQKDYEALAKATGTTSIQAQQLSKNYDTLASTTSSVSEKLSALKSNLDILNGGKQTQLEVEKKYQQGLQDTADALSEIASREGVRMADLVSSSGQFNMASQASRDLHTELSKSAEGILEVAVSAYDNARQNGATLEEAQQTAMGAMSGPLQSFRDSLSALGFGQEQIDGIVQSLGLVPEQVETALLADGNQAIMEAARTELAMKAFSSGNYTAVLAALPDAAKQAVGEAYGVASEFANGDYEAVLKAMDETPGGREAALASLLTVTDGEYVANLKANNMIPEAVAQANAAAQQLLPGKEVAIVANDTASEIIKGVNELDVDNKIADISANDSISSVIDHINASPLTDKENKMTTEDLVSQVIEDINQKQMNGKMTPLQAKDMATAVMDEVNAKTLDGKAATLTVNDLATTAINHIGTLRFDPKKIDVIANDAATATLTGVNEMFMPDKNLNLQATDLVSSVLSQINSSPMMDKESQLTTEDYVSQIIQNINATSLNNKMSKAEMQDLSTRTIDFINAQKLLGKSNTLTTQDLVSQVLRDINNTVLPDKTQRIYTYHNTIYSETREASSGGGVGGSGGITRADGGIIKNGQDIAFANGGILNKLAVNAFANGTENHVAQIARGAWPVRIWAEPETEGEAYIPLAKSKRKRSLEILKKVMAEFGLGNLTKAFADGGIMPAVRPSSVTSNMYATPSSSLGRGYASATSPAPNISLVVNPSEKMDEEQIGNAAAKTLHWNFINR